MAAKSFFLLFIFVLAFPAILFAQIVFDPPVNRNAVINFPDTEAGEISVIGITAQNRGNAQGTVIFNAPGEPFAIEPARQEIAPGGIFAFNLSFRPNRAGNFRGQLTGAVAFGMAIQRIGPAAITGIGVEENDPEPDIWVRPDEIDVEIDEEGEPAEANLTVGNNGDGALLASLELEEDEWAQVDPRRLDLNPGREAVIDVTIDAGGLENGDYETRLTIESNDPDTPEIEIPIRLTVNILQIIEQTIELERGWSMISSHIDFAREFIDEEGPDIELILAEIVDQTLIIKNGRGQFCTPAFDYWGIPFWNTADGYLIKLEEDTELVLAGELIPFDREIELDVGWNMIAFYPTYNLTFGQAMESLVEQDLLILAKDGRGRFYTPEFGFGWDIVIEPGAGLLVKVRDDCALQYPPEPE